MYGYDDGPHGGHGEIQYDHVRVPVENVLGPQGGGFMMAQARLAPGGSTTACAASGSPNGPSS